MEDINDYVCIMCTFLDCEGVCIIWKLELVLRLEFMKEKYLYN